MYLFTRLQMAKNWSQRNGKAPLVDYKDSEVPPLVADLRLWLRDFNEYLESADISCDLLGGIGGRQLQIVAAQRFERGKHRLSCGCRIAPARFGARDIVGVCRHAKENGRLVVFVCRRQKSNQPCALADDHGANEQGDLVDELVVE